MEMDGDHYDDDGVGVVVVIVPLPAQGHLNQLLHLSRLLCSRGVPVHYIGSITHNRQAKNRVHGWNNISTTSNIYFHDYQLPPFLTPPPDPNASNKIPFHIFPTLEAATNLRQSLSLLLQSLSPYFRRVAVVHDSLMSFAAEEASSLPNAEAYCLNCISIFSILQFTYEQSPSPSPTTNVYDHISHSSVKDTLSESFLSFVACNVELRKFDVGDIYNSCEPMEGRFIELMAQHPFLGKDRIWTIGPLNPVVLISDAGGPRHKCLQWLDRQPPSSVIYVSFGTMTSISDEQITQIAMALERSKQKFIWVLRDADKGDIYKEGEGQVRKIQLPDGYEERVVVDHDQGFIERDWAPQLDILAHSSTGGFLSHCGWNSCMESLSMGVAIAAWPMHSDQPHNASLVTNVLRVGLVVREWTPPRVGQEEVVCSAATIETAITKLMVLEEGKEIQKRAKELGVAVRQAVSDTGSSTTHLDSFLAHISRI